MKLLKYIWMIVAAGLFMACSDDLTDDVSPIVSEEDEDEVAITISPDDMLPVNMNASRGSGSEFLDGLVGHIADLNIRVHTTQGATTFFATADNFADILVDGKPNTIGASLISNPTETRPHSKTIHCGKKIKSGMVTKIEAIANIGKSLHNVKDWSTVYVDSTLSYHMANCQMYGKWEKGIDISPVGNTHKDIDGKQVKCNLYTMQIRRSVALVSVKMIDAGLNPGVMITPVKVRLCNVPDRCQLTALGHKKGEAGNAISIKDAGKGTVGVASQPIGMEYEIHIGSLDGVTKSLGNHIEKGDVMQPKDFRPIFMYENTQGKYNVKNTDHVTKYPAGITTVADAKNRDKNFKYSYIELEADYKLRQNNTVKIGGKIIYRFFLGADATSDFNVEGNGYYRLTLSLSGFGGAKEDGKIDAKGNLVVNNKDLSWRVDMQTSDWGFEKDQYDFDSHYIDGAVNVVGNNWKFKRVVKGDGNSSWLTLNIQKHLGEEWANPTTIVEQNCKLNIVDGKLRFNIQPMVCGTGASLDPAGYFDETTYKKPINYREMQIEVMNIDDKKTQIVTVRQYAPIPVVANGETFYMERFEEYGEDEAGRIIIGYPWGFAGNNLKSLKDHNNFNVSYNYGNTNKNNTGLNSNYLYHSSPKPKALDRLSIASGVCFEKGQSGVKQGAEVYYYALPTEVMMDAMFNKASEYDSSWGPFEPMHVYEDYWTSTVEKATPTESRYFDGNSTTYKNTDATHTRNDLKRVRAVYTVHKW